MHFTTFATEFALRFFFFYSNFTNVNLHNQIDGDRRMSRQRTNQDKNKVKNELSVHAVRTHAVPTRVNEYDSTI